MGSYSERPWGELHSAQTRQEDDPSAAIERRWGPEFGARPLAAFDPLQGAFLGEGHHMGAVSVCINTQTPLLQFSSTEGGSRPVWEFETDLSKLHEGVDYRFSPGGVTRMVYPLARRLIAEGAWRDVHWVSLNPRAPETVSLPDGITLHNVALDRERLDGYGKAKEAIWTTVHGLAAPRIARDLFWTDDYGEYTYYNRTTAELIRHLDRTADFDIFYIHDFQQLPIGHMLGTLKPKVFRWHIPFDGRRIPAPWRPLLSTYLNSYDVIVVSAERYRASLKSFGHRGRVERLYPYVDPREYGEPTPSEEAAALEKFGISPEDVVALVVARMDPAKRQDRVIEALARLARGFPRLRLVLAGNGSFSGTRGGLGLSKADLWRRHLEATARSRNVADRVVFTGHVSQRELECLYRRCAFTILPSTREGFGLVVVESWLYRKPTVVSRQAGIADLIDDGENGILFDPDRPGGLERAMTRLLRDPGPLRERLGNAGFRTARRCSVDAAVRDETRLLVRVVEN